MRVEHAYCVKTFVWKHEYDVKLWLHKQRTPNTNDRHMPLNETPHEIFLRTPLVSNGVSSLLLELPPRTFASTFCGADFCLFFASSVTIFLMLYLPKEIENFRAISPFRLWNEAWEKLKWNGVGQPNQSSLYEFFHSDSKLVSSKFWSQTQSRIKG